MQDYAATYQGMTDDELENILEDFNNLIDEAKQSLRETFYLRGKNDEDIAMLIEAGRRRKIPLHLIEGADIALTHSLRGVSLRSFFLLVPRIGRGFRGKSNLIFDETYGYEEFDTTLCFTVNHASLMPLASYRIRQRPEWVHGFNPIQGAPFVVVARLPFQWRRNIWRFWFLGWTLLMLVGSLVARLLSHSQP